MFNVDMIGDRNLHIHRESRSNSLLTDLIFRDAQDLGYGRYFLERPLSVEDDHMSFVRAGIPAVELISLDYGPFNIFWHTPFDTVGKCNAVSLGVVGRVLLDALDDLESGRTPKPLLAFLESGAAGMLSDPELTELRSFWMWDPLKEKWDFIRDWEAHKVEAMRKFKEYVFGRGGALGQEKKRYLPLSRWLQ
jgi:hypothetical protein